MNTEFRVFGVEDEGTDVARIKTVINDKEVVYAWASEQALKEMEDQQSCDLVLAEMDSFKPDCLIVDLALTTESLKAISEEEGKEFPFTDRKVEEIGGGLVLLREIKTRNLLTLNQVCVFTGHSSAEARILTRLVKYFLGFEIPLFQKGDEESEFNLREFVYSTKGFRTKYVYTLLSQGADPVREHIVNDLESISESLKIKWIKTSRMSLENAKQHWPVDKNVPFDLAFVDLSLSESDHAVFDKIKDEYVPRVAVESFTPLGFAREFKKVRPSCTLIFLSEIEKRSLVIFLLSKEIDGDWVIHKTSLTKSLVALLIKLFIAN